MKYRKKPVVIEAFLWTADENQEEDPIWLSDALKNRNIIIRTEDHKLKMFINTLEGTMEANVGDYIIQGVQGEIYACKPDIFNQTYDKV